MAARLLRTARELVGQVGVYSSYTLAMPIHSIGRNLRAFCALPHRAVALRERS